MLTNVVRPFLAGVPVKTFEVGAEDVAVVAVTEAVTAEVTAAAVTFGVEAGEGGAAAAEAVALPEADAVTLQTRIKTVRENQRLTTRLNAKVVLGSETRSSRVGTTVVGFTVHPSEEKSRR